MITDFDLTVKALREKGLSSDEILEELSRLFQEAPDFCEGTNTSCDDEVKIKNVLNMLYMPRELQGYSCWVYAILSYKKSEKKSMKMKELYIQVAEAHEITPFTAEKSMRYAIGRVFDRCPTTVLYSMFGNKIDYENERLKNRNFLVCMAELI